MFSTPFEAAAFAACAAGLAALYFHMLLRWVHVLQQCSYQLLSYRRWLRENRAQLTPARRFVVLPGMVLVFFVRPPAGALVLLALAAFQWWLNPARHGRLAKKPLVFTARVRRLAAVSALFPLLCLAFLALSPALALCALGACVCLAPLLCMLTAALAAPLERFIAQRYINDARRRLRSMERLFVVGITGSYGKTSVKHYLYALLSPFRHVYMTPGNFNTTLGVTRAVREGLLPTHEIFLCEMGARHTGDIAEICELVQPDMGIITAIGEQHLETFGSHEAIARTKLELYDSVRARGGDTVLNWDCEAIAGRGYEGHIIRCGRGGACEYRVSDACVSAQGTSFCLHAPDGTSERFETRLLGRANLQNAALALACAHRLGIPLHALRAPLARLRSVEHRLELKQGAGYTLIDDAYNSNPEGAAVALETLAGFPAGGRIVITPGLVELGGRQQALNTELGRRAAAACDYAVLIGRRQAPPIREGLLSAGFDERRIAVFDDVRDGLAFAASLPGGAQRTVLLLNDLPDNYR